MPLQGSSICAGLKTTTTSVHCWRSPRAPARTSPSLPELTDLAAETPSLDGFGGRLAGFVSVAAAEATRATGSSDPASWAAAERSLASGDVWLRAYARYRHGESLLGKPSGRRDAEARLREAYSEAAALSATPLVGWIEALARRARIELAPDEPAAEPVAVAPAAPDLGLTTREREVLQLVAEGLTNRRIAETLFISESTAGVHVSNILGKLGVATRTEAATTAARLGLIE